jgi:hypothetical protein
MEVSKSDLSPERRQLVETMQQINYGRILNLVVRAGEPTFTPSTRIERQFKFGGDCQPRTEVPLPDFALKSKVTELLDCIGKMQDGTITQLEVKGGLPFGMTVEEQVL